MAKGQKTGGRQAGTPNRITTAFKDAVKTVYQDIGGNAAFAAWARENPTEFYKVAARLIPTEIAPRDQEIGITIVLAPSDSAGRVIECAPLVRQLGHVQH
jgi:hypothetical protein